MHRFISRFRAFFAAALSCVFCAGGCSSSGAGPLSRGKGYVVRAWDDSHRNDVRWAEYLYDHLSRRAADTALVQYETTVPGACVLTVRIDPALDAGFRIEREKTGVGLTARGDAEMLWLQYQLMKTLGTEDTRIEVSDLPPAFTGLKDTAGTFAFEYRGIYSLSTRDADYAHILGADNADEEWGLWGHNLGKAVGSDPTGSIYATVDGKKDGDQFCFSSEELYLRLERYVSDRYGEGETASVRFVVAPNDNPSACTCPDCLAAGNAPGNATPAVAKLVTRLARRFPGHTFFTTSYLSTREVPAEALPANAGVVVSAMELPLRYRTEEELREMPFADRLERWKTVTRRIYVWDYINNFDDYLTPFPVLEIMRERLRFFRGCGVSGVFLNGSGYDYSAFDDLKTYVLSALLIDPDLSVGMSMRKFLEQEYPVSGELLYGYCSELERRAVSGKKSLDLYGGIRSALRVFLDAPGFAGFYEALEKAYPAAGDGERQKLDALSTALAFTRLEIARDGSYGLYGYAGKDGCSLSVLPVVPRWLDRLAGHTAFPDMKKYREAGGDIAGYIGDWKRFILQPGPVSGPLLGQTPEALSAPDEGYGDLSVLTDGTPGFPDNYHCGWVIFSRNDLGIAVPLTEKGRAGTFRMTFLNDRRHRIYPPQEVQLFRDGKPYKTFPVTLTGPSEGPGRAVAAGPVDCEGAGRLSVKAIRPDGERVQIAVDEISLIP